MWDGFLSTSHVSWSIFMLLIKCFFTWQYFTGEWCNLGMHNIQRIMSWFISIKGLHYRDGLFMHYLVSFKRHEFPFAVFLCISITDHNAWWQWCGIILKNYDILWHNENSNDFVKLDTLFWLHIWTSQYGEQCIYASVVYSTHRSCY